MKPLKLILQGFTGIFAAFGRDSLTLDLETIPKDATLVALVGPNGAGKSTILDSLHPYRVMPSRSSTLGPGGRFINRGTFPTMVARAVDAAGMPITLHRTYLTSKGDKAPLEDPKKQMKGIRKLDGAAIRLVEVPESRTLGLTEGIETGVAVATGYRYRINVWSLLNCVNLALADIPEGRFDKIIIFADHDRTDLKKGYRPGEHFALLLKERLVKLGYEVEIKIPLEEGTDFADVWCAIQEPGQKIALETVKEQAAIRPAMQPRPSARSHSRPYVQSQQQ